MSMSPWKPPSSKWHLTPGPARIPWKSQEERVVVRAERQQRKGKPRSGAPTPCHLAARGLIQEAPPTRCLSLKVTYRVSTAASFTARSLCSII